MTQEKVLNYWNVFNTLYKALVSNESFKTPPVGETIASLRCDFVFKAWRFCGIFYEV